MMSQPQLRGITKVSSIQNHVLSYDAMFQVLLNDSHSQIPDCLHQKVRPVDDFWVFGRATTSDSASNCLVSFAEWFIKMRNSCASHVARWCMHGWPHTHTATDSGKDRCTYGTYSYININEISIHLLLLQMHVYICLLWKHVTLRCGDYAFLDFAGMGFLVQAGCSWFLPYATCKVFPNCPWFQPIPRVDKIFKFGTTAQEQGFNRAAMVESKRYLGSILGNRIDFGFCLVKSTPMCCYF